MLAHVPSFGRNPRGSPDFLAYPVPKACMHVLGTRVPRRLGVARSASSPKAALALGCSLTPGLRISFGRVTCMARAASVPGLWALGFLLLACVCGWVRVAFGGGFCLPLPVVAGVLGGCVWARFVVLSLFCRLFVVFVVGLWCRPAFRTCVVSCAFPLPPAVSGFGVRCGRACWARVSAVPRPSWLGCRVVFSALFFFFSGCWVSPSRALWSLPPSPFFRAGLLAFVFFFLSACFGAPFPAGPLFLAWCCRFWLGGPPVPVWGSCLRCPLGGGFGPLLCCWRRFGGCGLFSRARPPPFFLGGGEGAPGCSSLCLSSAGACSVAGVWCGWSLATSGGGSCVLLPATPGWVSLPVVVGGPRHSWVGSAGGGGVWRWCVGGVVAGVWCGWSLATPGGGSCVLLPATPGWVSLPLVVGGPRHSWLGSACGGGVWCVVCGGGVLVGLWRVCGVVGPSPLLAVVPVCYCPPLLAGFRCRWWWAVPATPGWGPLAAVVCGVWCVVCGGGVLVGLFWCVVWLVPRHSWRRFLCATPRHSWLGFAAAGGGRSPPLLAGVRLRRWCVVCGVWRWCVGGVVAGVWCGWSLATPGGGSCVLLPATPGWVSLPVVVGGPRHSWLGSAGGVGVWCVAVVCCWGCGWCVVWLVPRHSWRRSLCATPRHSWLGFAAGGGGRSPPLLAGVRWRRWCVVCGVVCGVLLGFLATPGGGSCVLLPATPGWVSLPLVVGGPRHSWLGSAGGGGVRALLGRVGRAGLPGAFWCTSPFPLAALSFCFAWPPPGWGCPSLFRCCRRSSLVVFLGLPLPGSRLVCVSRLAVGCSLVVAPPPPPHLCVWRFSSLLLVAFVFFFSPSSSSSVRPRCLRLSLVSGPGCPGPRRLRCLFCWPSASRLSVRLSLFRAFRLAVGCSRVVAAPPPPPLCRAVFVPAARCCVPCCAVRARVRCCAALLRVVSPGVVLSCAVLRSFGAAACCAVPSGAARRPGALCSAALCFAVFPRAVCSVLCVFCRGVVVRAVVRRSALCCVCLGVLCCAFPVLSVLCGAVLRCAGALALCCSCGACCCCRLVLWCAAVCCAVSCGVPWCGAGFGGPWLSAGGVFRCRCPCLAAWSASLWLVWFAVVPCFPVLCSVVLCCRVVLCCCALLSCCGAVGACFALLWAVVLCCVVLLVGCAVFGPVVVSACCGALFLALCVPCLLRSVRCAALLCWLWCPASLCRVLWRCAVVWCCAVLLCCRFAVLFVFALPSCGLSCGARVGASCCGVSLCVVVSPWAFCGVVVLLWCVVVSCCAVRCPVVSCALCRVLRCRAVLRCCAGWLCCAVVCAAGVCFVLFSFAKNPCRFSVPFKKKKFFFFENKIKLYTTQHTRVQQDHVRCCALRVTRRS